MSQGYLSRKLVWLFLALFSTTWIGMSVSATPAWAQEEKAAAAGEKAGETEHGEQKSYAWWIIESSGFIGLVLFILSIYFVAVVARMFFELRPTVAMPPDIVEAVQGMMGTKDFKSIYNVVKDDPSMYARLIAVGVSELPAGLAEARDVMERMADAILVEMEKRLSILAVLGTLGPMIGLLGTLKGMIASFAVIALSDTQLKASQVAGGISEALILTFEGVALSVPAIYFFSLFKNRVMTLLTQASLEADQTLRHIAHSARAKQAPAAAAAAGGQPGSSASVSVAAAKPAGK